MAGVNGIETMGGRYKTYVCQWTHLPKFPALSSLSACRNIWRAAFSTWAWPTTSFCIASFSPFNFFSCTIQHHINMFSKDQHILGKQLYNIRKVLLDSNIHNIEVNRFRLTKLYRVLKQFTMFRLFLLPGQFPRTNLGRWCVHPIPILNRIVEQMKQLLLVDSFLIIGYSSVT